MNPYIALEDQYSPKNYAPYPVVFVRGEGVYLWDDQGKKYIDMLAAYSTATHGHCHPKLVKALTDQAKILTITSRAYYSNNLGAFLKRACELANLDKAIPMNSGAEAVETGIKAVRKWAYDVKGVEPGKAEIIACTGNFHGRTITTTSISTEKVYKHGFEPLTPGFKIVPYGDADAFANAITQNTAAFLVEPIQGEGGINVPPEGYLKQCFDICKANNVLFLADEIQTGMGQTGKFLACEHENITPDGVMLGKAIGGAMQPVSLFISRDDVIAVFIHGTHGSTFGGNPLAAAVGIAAIDVLLEEKMMENSAKLGEYFINQLRTIDSPLITDIRGKGLFIGIEVDLKKTTAKDVCLKLLEKGLASRATHQTVIRLTPPLVITKSQIDDAFDIIKSVLA